MMSFPAPDDIARILSAQTLRAVPTSHYSSAAVLIPLIAREETGKYDILLTLRTEAVEHHKGQVAFPGGAKDANDRDDAATALRETEEEIGISASYIRVLGELNKLQTPSGFIITPVVGYLPLLPPFSLQRDEVAEAFCVPLSFFSDAANVKTEIRFHEGRPHDVFFYHFGGYTIWGITARIIREFLQVLESAIE